MTVRYRVNCFRIFTDTDGSPTYVPEFDLSRLFSSIEDAVEYMVNANTEHIVSDYIVHRGTGECFTFSVHRFYENDPVEVDCDAEFYAEAMT